MTKITLLGVDISTDSKQQLLDHVSSFLSSKKSEVMTIVTPNPEQIVLAQKDEKFRKILNDADISLPDGAGVVWGLRRRRSEKLKTQNSNPNEIASVFQRIPGIEFMESLVALAAENNYSIGLVGGNEGTAAQTLTNLQKKYPSLVGFAHVLPKMSVMPMNILSSGRHDEFNALCVEQNSSYSLDEIVKETAQKIFETKSRIVFIALGAPKQEYCMSLLKSHLTQTKMPIVLMVVGGSFDVLSGNIARAPKFIQNLNLEWLWRLIQEPWRIGRQLNLLKFIQLVLSKT